MLPSGSDTACPACHGRGWVIEADHGVGTARRCACHKEAQVPRLIEAAGFPSRYRHCRLASFKTSHPDPGNREQLVQALRQCERYVESFLGTEGGFRPSGLLFIGPPGVGKTHLAVAVLHELILAYRARGKFVDFTSLLDQIQSTFEPGAKSFKAAILHPILRAEVLVLDELGAQKPSPWVSDILYLIMNTRYANRLPTIFTTNYRLGQPSEATSALDRGPDPEPFSLLSTRMPPMLLSRLYEMAKPILLDSVGDYRREILHQQLR
jgi:DNA replication protein DnaC